MLENNELISIYSALCKIHQRRVVAEENKDVSAVAAAGCEYSGLIDYLISTGWDDCLPMDMEPDDKYLPPSYLKLRADMGFDEED
ncbi:hypothetical protein K6Y31_21590 [Motilimonas cestriensis]|uniref:Uncharacterized protein n=1 Tax=Motilimonas cestriensis TaxID=2742685 RepID=A0ABS8WGB6_9GAMM|nr:hypothetical protein [Motilimonas cestriensis]MCE2597368.1 hypothetical protein [Motilimonas cestriensis]